MQQGGACRKMRRLACFPGIESCLELGVAEQRLGNAPDFADFTDAQAFQ